MAPSGILFPDYPVLMLRYLPVGRVDSENDRYGAFTRVPRRRGACQILDAASKSTHAAGLKLPLA